MLLDDQPQAPRQRQARGGQPASRGLPAVRGGDVIPIRPSTQLVPKLIGGSDPYVDNVLSKARDITPGMMGEHFLPGLVPADEDLEGVAEMQTVVVRPLNETVQDDGDIADGAGRASRRNKDLAGGHDGGEAA